MSGTTPARPATATQQTVRSPMPLQVRLPAEIDAVPTARHELARWLKSADVGREVSEELALVVTELVTNAIEASPGPRAHVAVQARIEPASVVLQVIDEGEGFDRAPGSPPELPTDGSVRGRGLPIVSALMDVMSIHRNGGRTAVEVVRRLPPDDT